MEKNLIVLVGIHSAGKSTIRKRLEDLGYTTEEECAEILRVNQNCKAGATAKIDFEYLVRQAETERDKARIWKTDVIFVESWHFLTLAYMLTRGMHLADLKDYMEYVKQQMNRYHVYCLFLKSDPTKILDRSRKLHSEEDVEQYFEFYKLLEENIQKILESLKVPFREFNTMKQFEVTINEVLTYLEEIRR